MKHEAFVLPDVRPTAPSIWWAGSLPIALSLAMTVLVLMAFPVMRLFDFPSLDFQPTAIAAAALSQDAHPKFPELTIQEPRISLARIAVIGPTEVFPDAKGPPLNLLAQVEKTEPTETVRASDAPEIPEGPILTETEQLIVDTNTQRRDTRIALARLVERTENGGTELASAVMAEPLLRRAEQETRQLDLYGDAVLLSQSTAMKQVALANFHASRAAVLMDIATIEAILG